MRTIAIWLNHGAINWFTSIFTGIVGHPTTHWWVEIETRNPNIWYCAHFKKINGRKGNLCLIKCNGYGDVCRQGEGRRNGDGPKHTEKNYYSPSGMTMGHVHDQMEKIYRPYDALHNNCHHFGEQLLGYAKSYF